MGSLATSSLGLAAIYVQLGTNFTAPKMLYQNLRITCQEHTKHDCARLGSFYAQATLSMFGTKGIDKVI